MAKALQHAVVHIQGMFEVRTLRKDPRFIDLFNWDTNQVISQIYVGDYLERPIELGDVYLLTIKLEGGAWSIVECGPRYTVEDIEICSCDQCIEPKEPSNDGTAPPTYH